jgi:hypothetical protein
MVDERMLRAGEVPGLGAAGMRMAVLPDVGVNFQVGAGLGGSLVVGLRVHKPLVLPQQPRGVDHP